MSYTYDNANIFAKILRGEIPNRTVLETGHALAFEDIAPRAPVHVLIIPKGPYVCYDHFIADASEAEVTGFFAAIRMVSEKFGLEPGSGGSGYRLVFNTGSDGVQEVPHMHAHLLAGRRLGAVVGQPPAGT